MRASLHLGIASFGDRFEWEWTLLFFVLVRIPPYKNRLKRSSGPLMPNGRFSCKVKSFTVYSQMDAVGIKQVK